MSISDELTKLAALRDRGILSADEFERAKARVLSGTASTAAQAPLVRAVNELRRSRDDRWFGGVCGGIGLMSGVAAWVWRAAFVLLSVCGGEGLLLYLLLWIFVPQQELPVPTAPTHL
jgi:phage shock protein PspC (stress-responsive transcriptional regulator)